MLGTCGHCPVFPSALLSLKLLSWLLALMLLIFFFQGTQSANPHNDYCQHFVDTGQRPHNFIRDVGTSAASSYWLFLFCIATLPTNCMHVPCVLLYRTHESIHCWLDWLTHWLAWWKGKKEKPEWNKERQRLSNSNKWTDEWNCKVQSVFVDN